MVLSFGQALEFTSLILNKRLDWLLAKLNRGDLDQIRGRIVLIGFEMKAATALVDGLDRLRRMAFVNATAAHSKNVNMIEQIKHFALRLVNSDNDGHWIWR